MASDEFLKTINLEKYSSLLNGQGFQFMQDIFRLNENDLDSVTDIADRNTILAAVNQIDIACWLNCNQLSQYEVMFRQNGINRLEDLKQISMSKDTLDKLEVTIPGHRKRMVTAASGICLPTVKARPVAYGYWYKQEDTPEFLWVKDCKMKSSIKDHDPIKLENCMVDTGSEVVTVKEDLMQELDLQFVQNIKSKGIHAVEEKPLYRGILILGSKELEVDVIPDSYNSVGCNVFQKFSHMIKGGTHLWFENSEC